jgi:hypothetical protein
LVVKRRFHVKIWKSTRKTVNNTFSWQLIQSTHLMKRENDDHLTWPFTGKLTVELLNQLEDDNHYCKTMTFPPDIEVSGRVVDEERSIKSWGMPRYVSNSNLGYNASKNCQYRYNQLFQGLANLAIE